MAADVFHPEYIVDASAFVARAFVPGVRTAYGAGASEGILGLPGGVQIPVIPDSAFEAYTHISEMPTAPKVTDYSATVCEIEWRIPMRLYVDRNNLMDIRRVVAPFYGRYLTAFHAHSSLGGTVNSARIVSFILGSDDSGAYLGMTLAAWQRLNLDAEAGPTWML